MDNSVLDFALYAKMKSSKVLLQFGFTAVLETKRQTKRFMLNQLLVFATVLYGSTL